MTYGQPYSHQIVATGATGTVHWSVLWGTLPPGITLGDDGVLSGTPTFTPPLGGAFRVQATDDVGAVTRLLFLVGIGSDDGGIQSTGATLPDGNSTLLPVYGFCSCATWAGRYQADGTLSAMASYGIDVAVTIEPSFVSHDLTKAIVTPVTTGGTTTEVVDAVTGATIQALSLPTGFDPQNAAFSPNDAYVALVDSANSKVRIYRTADWSFTRDVSAFGPLSWSPASSELIVPVGTGLGAPVQVWSAESSASDRTVPTPNTPTVSGCWALDWSSTNRFAMSCQTAGHEPSIATMSAVDGSDLRVVVAGQAISGDPTCCTSFTPNLTFSPSGGYLALTSSFNHSPDPPTGQVVVAADADGATLTTLATFNGDHGATVGGWN